MNEAQLTQKKKKALKVARVLAKLYPKAKVFLSHGNPWELLIATILSAQCTDAMVDKVTEKLFKKYKTFDNYVRAKPKIFEQNIHSTGFYRQKTKNVLAAAHMVQKKSAARCRVPWKNCCHSPAWGEKPRTLYSKTPTAP